MRHAQVPVLAISLQGAEEPGSPSPALKPHRVMQAIVNGDVMQTVLLRTTSRRTRPGLRRCAVRRHGRDRPGLLAGRAPGRPGCGAASGIGCCARSSRRSPIAAATPNRASGWCGRDPGQVQPRWQQRRRRRHRGRGLRGRAAGPMPGSSAGHGDHRLPGRGARHHQEPDDAVTGAGVLEQYVRPRGSRLRRRTGSSTSRLPSWSSPRRRPRSSRSARRRARLAAHRRDGRADRARGAEHHLRAAVRVPAQPCRRHVQRDPAALPRPTRPDDYDPGASEEPAQPHQAPWSPPPTKRAADDGFGAWTDTDSSTFGRSPKAPTPGLCTDGVQGVTVR